MGVYRSREALYDCRRANVSNALFQLRSLRTILEPVKSIEDAANKKQAVIELLNSYYQFSKDSFSNRCESSSAPPQARPMTNTNHLLDQLADFIEEGANIRKTFIDTDDADLISKQASDWDNRVQLSLEQHLGKSYAVQFRNAQANAWMGMPSDHNLRGGTVWQLVGAKMAVLSAIIDQLRSSSFTGSNLPKIVPPRNLIHWSSQLVPSDNAALPYRILLTIQTDETIENPNFRIVCDAPCNFDSFDMGVIAVYGTSRPASDRVIEIGLRQSFTPRTPLTIVLLGTTMFRVEAVERIY